MHCLTEDCPHCLDPLPFLFSMAYQPIVDVEEARIDSYEALVRGPNGEGAAEVLSRVTPQTVYQFERISRFKAIEMAGRLGMERPLHLNFLPTAVVKPKLCILTTLEVASRSGFRPDCLTFEIVETERAPDLGHLLEVVGECRRLGFKIALDDFATGYSGLSRLAQLRPDTVKLDRSLVRHCDQDRTRRVILASMLALSADLGAKVIAEGVETEEELAVLRDMGARYIQGFYFSRPIFEGIGSESAIFAGHRDGDTPHC